MKFRLIFILTGMFFPVVTTYGQYAEDALRYSRSSVSGSARFQAMGGVNTALGADVSTIAGNPAGLGFFRKSEWSISPALGFANTSADYLGTSTKDSKVNFSIANMGIVFASPKSDIKGGAWRGGSFGISFSRINNFHNQFTYRGVNNQTSLTNYLVEQTDDLNISESELQVDVQQIGLDVPSDLSNEGLTNQVALAQLAYLGFLIDPLDEDGDGQPDPENYYISGVGDVFRVNQSETVKTTGGHYQWNFSYGGNIADKLYFGASLGIARLRYSSEKAFTETVLESDFDRLDNFTLTDIYDASGTGVNGTLGVIFRPNDLVRFGVSATTPTYYRIIEESRTSLYTDINNSDLSGGVPNITLEMAPTDFEYTLTTPFKASGGVAFFLGKNGFVSGDVEYMAYNDAKLGSELSDYNRDINDNYKPTINFRVGGEYRKDILRVRGGFAYFGDPYDKELDNLDRTRMAFTGGVGVRLPSFYVDLGVVHSRYKSGYTPYVLKNQAFEPSAIIQNAFTNAVISFGTFF
jgi:hypothetical protein